MEPPNPQAHARWLYLLAALDFTVSSYGSHRSVGDRPWSPPFPCSASPFCSESAVGPANQFCISAKVSSLEYNYQILKYFSFKRTERNHSYRSSTALTPFLNKVAFKLGKTLWASIDCKSVPNRFSNKKNCIWTVVSTWDWGPKAREKLLSNLAIVILTSISANRLPTQFLGPAPNGSQDIGS